MTTEVLMPKLGFAMEEGDFIEWLVQDGAEVGVGDMIFTIETEKATQEMESPASGTIRIKVVTPGTYPVGTQLAIIE